MTTHDQTMEQYFRSATFTLSAANLSQCPDREFAEVAFAGRSNAGKSSALNKITGNKKLARTSKTPGRTQLINFFDLNDQRSLVDLPGYGFAKVSMSKKIQWQKHLTHYLEHRSVLSGLILLVDSRLPLQPFDITMIEWAVQYNMLCHIMLTKSDKLSRNAGAKALAAVKQQVADSPLISAQLFSAHSGDGLTNARSVIYQFLHDSQSAQ